MADSFAKKSLQQKKAKKKQDKQERKEERKNNNNKGKSLEEMLMYTDEYGNLTSVPPDQQNRTKVKLEDIQLGAAPPKEEKEYTGLVTLYFEEKAYGFITEDESREKVFVHSNNMIDNIKERDKVSYTKIRTPKGFEAIQVKKLNK